MNTQKVISKARSTEGPHPLTVAVRPLRVRLQAHQAVRAGEVPAAAERVQAGKSFNLRHCFV